MPPASNMLLSTLPRSNKLPASYYYSRIFGVNMKVIMTVSLFPSNAIILFSDSRHTDDALSALMNEELITDVDISSGEYKHD